MLDLVLTLIAALRSALKMRRELVLENLALRQQLSVLRRRGRRPRLRVADRLLWVGLRRAWAGWREALVVVQPATVVRWHRQLFRRYWTWKSHRRRPGRPQVSPEVRDLVRRMVRANPLWGAPRIHGELLKLGLPISQRTVSRLMPRPPGPPSQTWRAFLDNHLKDLVSMDFFTVPTACFRVLFAFLIVSHDRRRVVHFAVTEHPTPAWTAQQVVAAFPWDTAPRYILRDRDALYSPQFRHRVRRLGITEVLTAPRAPWQNPYVERLVGSIRRECLDHVVVRGEAHLRRILDRYLTYYHRSRTHLALAKDAPEPRPVQPPTIGEVVELAEVGGLHHRYERRAA